MLHLIFCVFSRLAPLPFDKACSEHLPFEVNHAYMYSHKSATVDSKTPMSLNFDMHATLLAKSQKLLTKQLGLSCYMSLSLSCQMQYTLDTPHTYI